MPIHDWKAVADLMWQGMTIQQACKSLDYHYRQVMWHLNSKDGVEVKQLLLDTSMLAGARDEICTTITKPRDSINGN